MNSLRNKTVSSDNKLKCANIILAGSCQLGDNCVFEHVFSSTKLQPKSVFENRIKANYTKKNELNDFQPSASTKFQQKSTNKKKNVICKHFNHNRCKFSKQCKFLHICRNFISGSCGSVKCSFDHVKLCPVLACNNKYCSFAHAPKLNDVNSPPWGPVPVSLSKDKNCKSHSSPFRRPFFSAPHSSKNFSSKFIRHSSKIDKPFPIPNSPPLSFATSSPTPHTEVLFPPPSQYAALYPPYSATNQQFLDGHESLLPTRPPFPALYETPPPVHSFYPSCLPCQRDSGLRLFNCLTMNPNCSPRASSISLPVPPPPNPQDKSFSYSNNSSFDVDSNSHPIKVKCAPLVPCSDYINLAPAKNPTTTPCTHL